MALAFILVFGGLLAAYMGLNNVSLQGILSDQHSPITPPTSGGSGSASPTASNASFSIPSPNGHGYGSFFSTPYTVGRTDQGVDVSGLKPGDPIHAPGNIKIIGILQNWYQGQPLVWYQFLNGPAKGRYGYVAEQITPNVTPGQTLQQGQLLGTYSNTGTALELGWATSTGQTLAAATTGYTEGQVTQAGQSFKQFLSSIGVK